MAKQNDYKAFIVGLMGFFVLIVGITLTLIWWDDVVGLFRGVMGMALAVGGLVILYSLNKK